jgi:hypothetical protein
MDLEQQPQETPDLGLQTSLFQMNLDAQNSYNLRSSASWAKVLGVAGIITGAIIVILVLIAMNRLSGYNGYDDYSSYRYRRSFLGDTTQTKTGLWIMIITGFIFIIGGIFSFNFGNKINAALKSNDQNGLNTGFAALRNYFAIRAITVIIVLLFLLMSLSRGV